MGCAVGTEVIDSVVYHQVCAWRLVEIQMQPERGQEYTQDSQFSKKILVHALSRMCLCK